MNLTAINNLIDRLRGRTLTFFSAGNQWRRRIALFLAVIGLLSALYGFLGMFGL